MSDLSCEGKPWVNVWVTILPQSCGDNIRFDAGLQGIKCDTAQNLQGRIKDKYLNLSGLEWPSYWNNPILIQNSFSCYYIYCQTIVLMLSSNQGKIFPSFTKYVSCVAFLLNAHLCLSPLEQSWAVQGFKEVNVAGNVPQSSQLPPIASTTRSTRKTLLFPRPVPKYENMHSFQVCLPLVFSKH